MYFIVLYTYIMFVSSGDLLCLVSIESVTPGSAYPRPRAGCDSFNNLTQLSDVCFSPGQDGPGDLHSSITTRVRNCWQMLRPSYSFLTNAQSSGQDKEFLFCFFVFSSVLTRTRPQHTHTRQHRRVGELKPARDCKTYSVIIAGPLCSRNRVAGHEGSAVVDFPAAVAVVAAVAGS